LQLCHENKKKPLAPRVLERRRLANLGHFAATATTSRRTDPAVPAKIIFGGNCTRSAIRQTAKIASDFVIFSSNP